MTTDENGESALGWYAIDEALGRLHGSLAKIRLVQFLHRIGIR